jgi:hypothetical protein
VDIVEVILKKAEVFIEEASEAKCGKVMKQ